VTRWKNAWLVETACLVAAVRMTSAASLLKTYVMAALLRLLSVDVSRCIARSTTWPAEWPDFKDAVGV